MIFPLPDSGAGGRYPELSRGPIDSGNPVLYIGRMTRQNLAIMPVESNRLGEALTLVKAVFAEFVAPDYSTEGVDTFLRFIDIARLQKQMDCFALAVWACFHARKIVGVLGTEATGHICLLFVAAAHHRQGIARMMLEEGLASFRQKNCTEITVNSSPFAVPAYRRLGFAATHEEQCLDGIRFTPMVLPLQ